MGNNTNSIEINGKRYDAITGAYLGESSSPVSTSKASAAKAAPRTSRAAGNIAGPKYVDGFRRAPGASATSTKPRTAHTPASHIKPHKPESAKTLMRTAVRKPKIEAPSRVKAQTPTDIVARTPDQVVKPKASHTSINPLRWKKATQMVKHPNVNKYAPANQLSTLQPTAAPIAAAASKKGHSTIDAIQSSLSRATIGKSAKPVASAVASPAVQQAAKNDIFAQALAKASGPSEKSTTEKKAPKRGRRFAVTFTALMSLFIIGGLLAYFNAPALSMQIAASRAGFSAKLPSNSPAGFNFDNLSYGSGNVSVSYASTADSTRRFDIKQQVSEWDSQALLHNFVANANKAYQTYQQAGRTIYLYGDNTATWVDSGVWYTVNGNSALSRDQILNLANSL